MELQTDEALKIHIEGLQATLTKRNARIAELEAKLSLPIDLPAKTQKLLDKAYKQGWKDCANVLMESTRDAALTLGKIRRNAFRLYVDGKDEE